MTRPEHEAQQVRNDDSDEADHSRKRDRRPHGGGDKHDAPAFQLLHANAHVERLVLAEHQPVEPARDERHSRGDEKHDGQQHRGFVPCRAAERAEHPELDVAQLAVVRDEHQKADARHREGADRQPGEQEHRDRRAPLARRDAVEDRGGDQRADECGAWQETERQRDAVPCRHGVADDDGGRGRQRASGRHADQSGIGKRIAEQPLHDGARHTEHSADDHRHRDARQADRAEDQAVARNQGRVTLPQAGGGEQAVRRNARGADAHGDKHRKDERGGERRQHEQARTIGSGALGSDGLRFVTRRQGIGGHGHGPAGGAPCAPCASDGNAPAARSG